jgi:hypothetical protein
VLAGRRFSGETGLDDQQALREIQALVGQSAGYIAYRPFACQTYLSDVLLEAAQAMWESFRSTWVLVEVWNNGATIWQAPDGTEAARVIPGGEIKIQTP